MPDASLDGPVSVYSARWVLPISGPPIEHGIVVTRGARIAFVGSSVQHAETVRDWQSRGDTLALGNAVLMPGLVNTHTHLELTGMRGMLEGIAFRDWLRTLTAARQELFGPDALLDAARLGVAEALRNGITTCADTTESGAPLEALREAGMRGIGYVETFGPDPRQCDTSISRLRDRVEAFRAHDTSLVRTGVSPHAPYSVSAVLFEAVARFAIDGAWPIAVHVAESAAETALVRDARGAFADALRARDIGVAAMARSPVALLEATGVLEARPLLIHAIRVDDDDLTLIASRRATIAHCPISNAKLGHGIAPLRAMQAAGIAVGLGTDSVVSNDRMDLLGEARQATLMASIEAGAPDALSAHGALRLATLGGAAALALSGRIGSLDVGKDADLAAFSLDHPDGGPVFDPAVTLVHVLAGKTPATLVTVAGRRLVEGGQLVDVGMWGRAQGLAERADAQQRTLVAWMGRRRAALA